MAFTVSDFEDLLRLLGEHPEWRDRLRPVILGDEILEIPSRMDRVEAALDRVTQTLRVLVERMDAFELRMDRADGRLDRIEGRIGNIEGGLLESKYARNVGSWFSTWLRRARELSPDEIEEFYDAAEAENISMDDLDAIHHLDLLVRGTDRHSSAGELLTFAVEISYTINSDDITRAAERAKLLESAGFRTRGFVGGYRVSPEAKLLADQLNVVVDLKRPPAVSA